MPLRATALRNLLAGALGVLAILAVTAAAAAGAKPAISHLKLSRGQLNSAGGSVTLSFRDKHASKCTIGSSPSVKHLAHKVSCSHGRGHLKLKIPANLSRRFETIKITVTAKRGRHAASKHVTLVVLGAPELALGTEFTCELINGSVYCWGADQNGQLGNGQENVPPIPAPLHVSLPARAVQIGAGYGTMCALLANGHVYCWGLNERGQVGTDTGGKAVPTPTPVAGVAGASSLWVGDSYACAVLHDGNADCWGNDEIDQLDNGKEGEKQIVPPVQMIDLVGVQEIAGGEKGAVRCSAEGQ